MPTETQNDIVDVLFTSAPIDQVSIRTLLQLARRINAADVELANSLVPEAGDYLPEWSIRALVRAEISDQTAQAQIVEQKHFVARLSDLLPSITEMFKFENRSAALNMLSCIDDCHSDARVAAGSPRKDKARRETMESIERATTTLAAALRELKAVQRWVDIDFGRHCAAVRRKRKQRPEKPYKEEEVEAIHYDNMLDQLGILLSSLRIKHHRALTEDDHLIISDNQVRTDVVEHAYTMSRYWNGPPLVTTPGAAFSTLCSLLYEAASGIRDESLSGAINRYARSEDRKTFDRQDNEILREQNEPNTDNFQGASASIQWSRNVCEEYRKVLGSRQWDVDEKVVILSVIEDERAKISAAEAEYGPHLIWAHQLPVRESPPFDRLTVLQRELDVLMGKLRRSGLN